MCVYSDLGFLGQVNSLEGMLYIIFTFRFHFVFVNFRIAQDISNVGSDRNKPALSRAYHVNVDELLSAEP